MPTRRRPAPDETAVPPLSDAGRSELRLLWLAAATLDLKPVIGPPVDGLPSVQALMRAAETVFVELGYGEDEARDVLAGA
ncbi:hypothetical protein OPKNFCMD_3457 [Methylobacterium crusticola]|uniref:Uncharacterized protein n=1 Tax=Methylobacterium crusticola TaxID=1697972 RepID=A0ABQ4QZ75_9HYPH|nr:hypothetical protein [Methylobacterium crusticola]GJD50712.1 hypothetical protein OPKNFCMD_3457 [Methylobacterium crusticola]